MEKIIALHEEGNIILVFPDRPAKWGYREIFCFNEGHSEADIYYLNNLKKTTLKKEKETIQAYLNEYGKYYEKVSGEPNN